MIAVDTNVLLRYLLQPLDSQNPAWQTQKALLTIDSAEEVFLSDIVLAETEWVMEAVFNLTRNDIHQVLYELASNTRFLFEDWEAFQCALMDYKTYPKVDFSDCLIARRAHNKKAETLYTFENNRKLGALPIVTTLTDRH
ncbi:type II toxin-antitoxin system VapC family toxin [Endozoicomonas sp. 8E]|uniref:PIN domain-containing protein n=1 Tax=Endozoicomonas sp. 8E TaxID=3035692 RepID=UPI0029394FBE|nr:type II toxin-antitoxin system VapC family toxin [Endozoicomonas sp. 8E]WOG29971.1 type II toxin-antitoxin system VapC family toxin [Endozoicomonas sp. 8E]